MNRIRFIRYKGKQILLLDFSSCKGNEIRFTVKKAKKIISGQKKNSLLTLTDIRKTEYIPVQKQAYIDYVRHNKPYVKAAALIGVNGIKKYVVNFVQKFTKRKFHIFDARTEAKEWLVKQK